MGFKYTFDFTSVNKIHKRITKQLTVTKTKLVNTKETKSNELYLRWVWLVNIFLTRYI